MVYGVCLNQSNFTINDVMTMIRVWKDIYFISKKYIFYRFQHLWKTDKLRTQNHSGMKGIQKPANIKDLMNYMVVLWYILTYAPYILQQARNLVSLDKIDVFWYPNDCYCAWFTNKKFGLKRYFLVLFWFFLSCVRKKWARWALCAKPQHLLPETYPF